MKRRQVQLDDATYQLLRRSAFEHFQFIGSGHNEQGELAPVSEQHDEAPAADFSH